MNETRRTESDVAQPIQTLPERLSILEAKRTVIPEKVEPVTADQPEIAEPNAEVSFLKVLGIWIKESLITEILQMKEGKYMTNDMKTNVAGAVTCIATIAAVLGFSIPAEWVTVIVSVGVAILGYFTNKKDKE